MGSFLNISGVRFGRLVAKNVAKRGKRGEYIWLCECDCGKEKLVPIGGLRYGHTRSCGCLKSDMVSQRSRKRDRANAIAHKAFKLYIRGALNRNYSFDICFDDFKEIVSKKCFYCGSEPKKKMAMHRGVLSDTGWRSNGLDRVDNSVGYTISNVVPCCQRCNRAKDTMTVNEFMNMARNIYNNSSCFDFSIVSMVKSPDSLEDFYRKAA